MCSVLPSSSHSCDADFVRIISRRFAHGGSLRNLSASLLEEIAQTQRIPARVEIAERAEADSAEIARAPGGQILLAPYRLPEKLAKTVWKKLHRPARERRRSGAASEYQEWFERHRANARDLERMRSESRGLVSRSLVSVITPVFDTPVQRSPVA